MTNERLGVSGAELDDLNLGALDSFIAQRAPTLLAASSRDEAAVRLGLFARVAPRLVPTLAGLYLFGKLPQTLFPEWGVVCMASGGTTLLEPIMARVDLDGALPALIDGSRAFIREQTGAAEASDGEYLDAAVREVIVNALIHRDLRKPSRVAVRMFADRLEVWSPGGPPEGLADLEELGREGGVSSPRNPLVASVARHLGYGEQLGRGLLLVVQRGAASLEQRVEIRCSPRDVMVLLPSRWQRPRVGQELS